MNESNNVDAKVETNTNAQSPTNTEKTANIEPKDKSNNLLLPILLVLAGGVLVWQLYFVPLDALSNEDLDNTNETTKESETKKDETTKEDVVTPDQDKDKEKEKEEEISLVFDNDLITFKYSKTLNIISEKKDCPGELLVLTDVDYDEAKGEKPEYTIKFNCNELSEGFTTIEDIYEQNKKYYQDNNITNYTLDIKEVNKAKTITGILPDINANEYKIVTFYDTKNKKIYEFTAFWKSEAGYSELDKIVNTITIK